MGISRRCRERWRLSGNIHVPPPRGQLCILPLVGRRDLQADEYQNGGLNYSLSRAGASGRGPPVYGKLFLVLMATHISAAKVLQCRLAAE